MAKRLAIHRSWVRVLAVHHCIMVWASYLHLCSSVTKQYNLVPAKKATVGLVETNGSLPPGIWLCQLQANCQRTGISSMPKARNQVRDYFTFSCIISIPVWQCRRSLFEQPQLGCVLCCCVCYSEVDHICYDFMPRHHNIIRWRMSSCSLLFICGRSHTTRCKDTVLLVVPHHIKFYMTVVKIP